MNKVIIPRTSCFLEGNITSYAQTQHRYFSPSFRGIDEVEREVCK
jgi:hypothetical protein